MSLYLQREILRENRKSNRAVEKLYNSVEYIHTHIFDSEYNSMKK